MILICLGLISCSAFAQNDLDYVLEKARSHEKNGTFEMARYYYSLAERQDTTRLLNYERKYFELDSSMIFNDRIPFNGEVRAQLKSGDTAKANKNYQSALTWYAFVEGDGRYYADYRIRQIFEESPSSKKFWLVLKTKINRPQVRTDSLNTQPDTVDLSGVIPVPFEWTEEDSLSYKRLLNASLEQENWEQCNHILTLHLIKFGEKEVFYEDMERYHESWLAALTRNPNTFRLKLEQIERIEAKQWVDEEKIRRILEGIDEKDITDEQTLKRYHQLKKKYFR